MRLPGERAKCGILLEDALVMALVAAAFAGERCSVGSYGAFSESRLLLR
jgi:hypothetical protein